MLFTFFIILSSFTGIFSFGIAVLTILILGYQPPTELLVGFILSFVIFTFITWEPKERLKKTEEDKKPWAYKNYQEVNDYLDTEKPHLTYEKEDKDKLIILLFFGWTIKDDSDSNNIVLERITKLETVTKTFSPLTKYTI